MSHWQGGDVHGSSFRRESYASINIAEGAASESASSESAVFSESASAAKQMEALQVSWESIRNKASKAEIYFIFVSSNQYNI